MIQQPDQIVAQKPHRTITIAIASISATFVVFIAALWGAGFFKFSGSDPSSKIVAAALALVGGLVAAVVSIIGILLKYSIDQRTESRLQIESNRAAAERKVESDRASALQTQSEQRLNLEAAIRAVELLGAEGSAGALQRAGALFALSNLEQHQLTLDLTSYLLQRDGLEPKIASSLIDRALKKPVEEIQRQALDVLYDHAAEIQELPDTIFYWDGNLPAYIREWAPFAMARILISRPLSIWKTKFPTEVNAIISVLGHVWRTESDKRLKTNIGAILKNVLKGFRNWGALYHPNGTIDTDQLASEVDGISVADADTDETFAQLESWTSRPAARKKHRSKSVSHRTSKNGREEQPEHEIENASD